MYNELYIMIFFFILTPLYYKSVVSRATSWCKIVRYVVHTVRQDAVDVAKQDIVRLKEKTSHVCTVQRDRSDRLLYRGTVVGN